MNVDNGIQIDLLDNSATTPALSATSDVPVVETKPDAQNEGAPPAAPAAAEPEVEGEAKTISESATEPEEPSANDEPKKAKGVQKRLDELTARIAEERAEKLRLMALLEQRTQPQPEAPAPEAREEAAPERPQRDQFDDPAAYDEAMLTYAEELSDWSTRKAVREVREQEQRSAQERALEEQSLQAQQAYQARTEQFKAQHSDWDSVATRADVQVSIQMAAAIVDSEAGPAMQYYLGQHPEEAARIMALPHTRQLVEMGKLEAKLTAPPPQPKPISSAPKPIAPITPSSETVAVDPENESMDSYAARRRKEMGYGDQQGKRPTRH